MKKREMVKSKRGEKKDPTLQSGIKVIMRKTLQAESTVASGNLSQRGGANLTEVKGFKRKDGVVNPLGKEMREEMLTKIILLGANQSQSTRGHPSEEKC